MDKTIFKELFNSLFEFMPLYHQTIGCIYHKDYGIEPSLNKSQQKALFIIQKKGRVMPSSLGKAMDMQKGSLTTLIDSLVEYGFVRREADCEDRRKQWIILTSQGEEYISKLMSCFEKEFERIFEKVDSQDIYKLLESIEFAKEILKNIKETGVMICK
ncbi:MarR family winged helix-turn-helix transcriptional regulator [Lutispora thermophila]|uniref:Transcriptional regulator, MarR family n=1 Tax=Lutispora thermophila DSM 19022 TaxID=1122184 RepID=A0A1M6B6E2_9FIRM|nr:MarR family transcriptional regulator [Lutispora thermophila]SHI44217.1 transcriptional regulator, MarR family [Lutispora thermophila DSM 19022]